MSPKSIILLAMALGCGLVAAVGINQIMARPADQQETVQIVVAKREIQKGDPFKPDDIRLQDWPKDTVPEGAIDSVDKLVDKRSRNMVYPGEPIIDKKLIGKGDMSSLAPEVPAGMKAVTVKVDNESGVSGMILPGDNVDVLMHVEANPSKQIFQTTTTPIETNMKVMAVDDNITRPDSKENSISAKTITLLATPKQAARITHACEIGRVRLVLRSGKDNGESSEDSVAISTPELFGKSTSSEPSRSPSTDNVTPLPPVTPEKRDLGSQFEGGVNSLRSLLGDLQKARTGQFEEKEKPFTVVLIEGPEAREVEFEPSAMKGRKGTGLAARKSSDSASSTSADAEKPAGEPEIPEETKAMMESLFKPEARRDRADSGGPKLVQ